LVTEAGQADLALQISLGLQINSHVYRTNAGLGQAAFEDYMHYIQALCFQAFSDAEEDGCLVDLQSHRAELWTNKSPVSLLNMPRVLSGGKKESRLRERRRSSHHSESDTDGEEQIKDLKIKLAESEAKTLKAETERVQAETARQEAEAKAERVRLEGEADRRRAMNPTHRDTFAGRQQYSGPAAQQPSQRSVCCHHYQYPTGCFEQSPNHLQKFNHKCKNCTSDACNGAWDPTCHYSKKYYETRLKEGYHLLENRRLKQTDFVVEPNDTWLSRCDKSGCATASEELKTQVDPVVAMAKIELESLRIRILESRKEEEKRAAERRNAPRRP
jgi:hypothetical protein